MRSPAWSEQVPEPPRSGSPVIPCHCSHLHYPVCVCVCVCLCVTELEVVCRKWAQARASARLQLASSQANVTLAYLLPVICSHIQSAVTAAACCGTLSGSVEPPCSIVVSRFRIRAGSAQRFRACSGNPAGGPHASRGAAQKDTAFILTSVPETGSVLPLDHGVRTLE